MSVSLTCPNCGVTYLKGFTGPEGTTAFPAHVCFETPDVADIEIGLTCDEDGGWN